VLSNGEGIEGKCGTVDTGSQPLPSANVIEDSEAMQDTEHCVDSQGDFGDSSVVSLPWADR